MNRISAEIIDGRRENSYLFELDRVYEVTLSSGLEALRIDYRKQNSSEYCIQRVGEVLVLVGDSLYDLLGWTCEHAAAEYETVLENKIDSFSPPHSAPARTPTPRPSPTPTPAPTPVPTLIPVVSDCSPAIVTRIDGAFEGWDGETIFRLRNGQIWKQAEFAYTYSYSYSPEVIIFPVVGGCEMQVDGLSETIRVRQLVPVVSNCSPPIESRIDGYFEGWDGDTIFPLRNGQIWQPDTFLLACFAGLWNSARAEIRTWSHDRRIYARV